MRFGKLPPFRKQYLVYCCISTLVSSVKMASSKRSLSLNAFKQKDSRFILFGSRISWQYRALSCFHPIFRRTFRTVPLETLTPRSSSRRFCNSLDVNSSLLLICSSMKFRSCTLKMGFLPLRWASAILPVRWYRAINCPTANRDVLIPSSFSKICVIFKIETPEDFKETIRFLTN